MIPVSENQVIYSGNGVNTAFSYSFKIIESTDLHLIRVAADGTETEVTSDYYVDMAASKVYYPGYAPGVEEAEADQPQILQTGEKLVVYRNVPITQQDDMPEQWPFDVIESALDKSCIIDQQLKGDIDRALKFSRAVGSNFNPTFPIIAGKTIRIKNDGSGFETTDDPAVVRTEVVALKNETVTAKNAAETAQANAEAAASTAAATAATTAVANVQSQLAQNLADTNAAKTAAQTASSSAQSALSSAQNAASVAEAKSVIATAQANIASQKAIAITDSANQIEANKNNIALLKTYVTPEMYGAVGDGVTDDTNSVIACLKYAISKKMLVKLVGNYKITNSLLTNDDYTSSIYINIEGNHLGESTYRTTTGYGGLLVSSGVDLFVGLNMYGSIRNTVISTNIEQAENVPLTGSIFKECRLDHFTFSHNTVASIGRVFVDTDVWSMSRITSNKFLFINNFCKCTQKAKIWYFVDSIMEGNYINGGNLSNEDNDCFEWAEWNGSRVINNFIDYYRCIYNPTTYNGQTKYFSITSIGNEYQVFMYLYNAKKTAGMNFVSTNDVFNWTNPEAETTINKFNGFTPFTYTDHNSTTRNVPNNVLWVASAISGSTYACIYFTNAKFENNIGNIAFVEKSDGGYQDGYYVKMTCSLNKNTSISDFRNGLITVSPTIYMAAKWLSVLDIPLATTYDSLPTVSVWSQHFPGERIVVDKKFYRLLFNFTSNAWEWQQQNSLIE